MNPLNTIKKLSIWIFIVPFVAVNTCLILITQFHSLFPNQENVILNTIPYIDGGTSISRTARVFPTYWIFKPAMFLTSYLLIKYWLWNKNIINYFDNNTKHLNYLFASGIDLIHELFKFENKFGNNLSSKIIKFIGNHKIINKYSSQFANKGLFI